MKSAHADAYEASLTKKAVTLLKNGKAASGKHQVAYEMAAMWSAMQGAIDSLSQPKVFEADIAHAKSLLKNAIEVISK